MNPVAQELYQRIQRDGAVNGQVIKVDTFLNHMVDPVLLDKIGAELYSRFADRKIDKIITAESTARLRRCFPYRCRVLECWRRIAEAGQKGGRRDRPVCGECADRERGEGAACFPCHVFGIRPSGPQGIRAWLYRCAR